MANTTLANVTGGATLTSGLTLAYSSASGAACVPDSKTTGKLYFEATQNGGTSNSMAVGWARVDSVYGSAGPTFGLVCRLNFSSGLLYRDGSNSGTTVGAGGAGVVYAFAADLDKGLYWIKKLPSGNWNGSGTADPATGVGGIAYTGFLTPYAQVQSTSDSVTLNFGDSAFSGTVPSGYGNWTTGAYGALVPTQLVTEVWTAGTDSSLYVSQLMAEVWSKTNTTNDGSLFATQLVAEVWATVLNADTNVNISGTAGTGSAGTAVGAIDKTITGVEATGSAGTAIAGLSYDAAITGVFATGYAGTVTGDEAENALITGASATGHAGTVTVSAIADARGAIMLLAGF